MDLAKLQQALGFSIMERERALEAVVLRYGLSELALWHQQHALALSDGIRSSTRGVVMDECGLCK